MSMKSKFTDAQISEFKEAFRLFDKGLMKVFDVVWKD